MSSPSLVSMTRWSEPLATLVTCTPGSTDTGVICSLPGSTRPMGPEESLKVPQAQTAPRLVSAAVCESPAQICTALAPPSSTMAGLKHSSSSPTCRPRLPSSLHPKVHTLGTGAGAGAGAANNNCNSIGNLEILKVEENKKGYDFDFGHSQVPFFFFFKYRTSYTFYYICKKYW